jgi:hypothetical protein
MTRLIPEENGTQAATTASKQRKPVRNALVARRPANVATTKTKAARKAKPAKKTLKGRTKAQAAKPEVAKPKVATPKAARDGSKTAKILDLLKRPGGATSKELMKATGWLPHSVRGYLSGTVGKKMGLIVTSTKGDKGERTYSVEA